MTGLRIPQSEARLGARDLEALTQGLALLLGSGLNPARALTVLASSAARPGSRALARRIARRLSLGQSIAAAFSAEGPAVPALYLDIIATGEAGSRLAPALSRLDAWLASRRRLRDAAASAALYPCLILAALGGGILALKAFILPRIAAFVRSLGPAAALSLEASMRHADAASLTLLAILAVAGTGLAALWILRKRGKAALERLILSLPLAGPALARRCRVEFAFSMESLCASGLGAGAALSRCAARSSNPAFAADLRRAEAALRRGEGLAAACAPSAFFDAESLQWLGLADSGGNPLAAFSAMRASAEAARARAEERNLRLMEPAFSLIAGGLVALFVALFVLPLFEAMGSLFG